MPYRKTSVDIKFEHIFAVQFSVFSMLADLRMAVWRVQVTTLAPATTSISCLLCVSLCLCTSCFSSPAISRLK